MVLVLNPLDGRSYRDAYSEVLVNRFNRQTYNQLLL